MTCDLNALAVSSQPWARMDTHTILAIQCGLMCDALNGIDPTTELNPQALQQRFNCFAHLSDAQLMGIWTILWANFIKGAFTQLVYYVNDPNAEGVRLTFTNLAAIALTQDGGGMFTWSTKDQIWK